MPFFLQPPKPFNLEAVVKTHGWFQLVPFYWNEREKKLLWAAKPPGRNPLLVALSQGRTNGRIRLEIPGNPPNEASIQFLKEKVRYIFQMNIDLSGFYQLKEKNPSVKKAARRGMGRIMRSPSLFEDLVKAICGTNCAWKQAVKMINRIGELGESIPGSEDYRLFPQPRSILRAGVQFLKGRARLGYRAESVVYLCRAVEMGRYPLQDAEEGKIGRDELERLFLSIRGIGKTTANYLLALHGHYDQIAIDSLVISFMARMRFNGKKPSPRQVKTLFESFGKWRYLVYWMEFILAKGWVPKENT